LKIIVTRSDGHGSREELVELDEKNKELQREVKRYNTSNGKWIKSLGRLEKK